MNISKIYIVIFFLSLTSCATYAYSDHAYSGHGYSGYGGHTYHVSQPNIIYSPYGSYYTSNYTRRPGTAFFNNRPYHHNRRPRNPRRDHLHSAHMLSTMSGTVLGGGHVHPRRYNQAASSAYETLMNSGINALAGH